MTTRQRITTWTLTAVAAAAAITETITTLTHGIPR